MNMEKHAYFVESVLEEDGGKILQGLALGHKESVLSVKHH